MYSPTDLRFDQPDVDQLLQAVAPLLVEHKADSAMTEIAETKKAVSPLLCPFFPGRWTNCRIVSLRPSGQIVAHRDQPIAGTRYHIPLQSNEGCWVFHSGVWRQLKVGQVYEMDPSEPHGAVNWGSSMRLHLMLDVE